MKILLTGKTGQVGYELERSLDGMGEIVAVDRSRMDLRNLDQVRDVIRAVKPKLIINPAAYTAVDKAESESDLAMRINAEAPRVMAEEAQKLGAAMIHYSTDYVFDGAKTTPYIEDDLPNPRSVYGRSKLLGEEAVAGSCQAHWIFRTSWVYGIHGSNFMKTVLRLAKERDSLRIIADQTGAPTWARSIAKTTATALQSQSALIDHVVATAGIYHLCANGSTTWYDYARHIVEQARRYGSTFRLSVSAIEAISTECYRLPASRPHNSQLKTEKLRRTFQLALPDWRIDVDDCLSGLVRQSPSSAETLRAP